MQSYPQRETHISQATQNPCHKLCWDPLLCIGSLSPQGPEFTDQWKPMPWLHLISALISMHSLSKSQFPKLPAAQSIFKFHVILRNSCQARVRALLLTKRDAQFISASLVVGRRTHCHSHESPPACSWHFPCLLQTCNYTPASLLTFLLLSSPALDLSLSTMGLFWLTSSPGGSPGQGSHCW